MIVRIEGGDGLIVDLVVFDGEFDYVYFECFCCGGDWVVGDFVDLGGFEVYCFGSVVGVYVFFDVILCFEYDYVVIGVL